MYFLQCRPWALLCLHLLLRLVSLYNYVSCTRFVNRSVFIAVDQYPWPLHTHSFTAIPLQSIPNYTHTILIQVTIIYVPMNFDSNCNFNIPVGTYKQYKQYLPVTGSQSDGRDGWKRLSCSVAWAPLLLPWSCLIKIEQALGCAIQESLSWQGQLQHSERVCENQGFQSVKRGVEFQERQACFEWCYCSFYECTQCHTDRQQGMWATKCRQLHHSV